MSYCNKSRLKIYRAFWVAIVLARICLVDVFLLRVCVTDHANLAKNVGLIVVSIVVVLKNIPEIQAQAHNEKTEFPYNKDIMEKAETDATLRGPPSLAFCNGLSNDST